MNVKLFFTNLIITFMGVLSLLLVFIRPFDAGIKYITVGVAFASVMAGAIATAVHMILKKKWIFWAGFGVIVTVFVWFFRYELLGGYTQFYNSIMDMYSNYFESEMYFLLPSAKLALKADMTLMLYFSIVIITCLYSVMIYTRRLLVVPILVNISLMAVPIIIDNNPAYPAVLLNVVFCIQIFVINSASKKVKNDDDAMASVQGTSLFMGAVVYILTGAVMFLVPGKDYEKSEVFNKVENYVVSVVEKIADKIASSIDGDNGFGIEMGAEAYIDNGKLGQVDSIRFDEEEMIQVETDQNGNRVYLKQFIGEDYRDNQWFEPVDKEFNLTEYMEFFRPQVMAAHKLQALMYSGYGEVPVSQMKIKYTGLAKERQLMPLTATVQQYYDYTKGESYFWEIPYNKEITYYDVTNEKILEWAKIVKKVPVAENWLYIDKKYTKYVIAHYLDVNTECEKQFKEVLKNCDVLSAEGIFKTAEYVRQHLAKRCTYTREPGALPEGEEFVDYFYNESKRGYCTYFATTAVMMLRSVGVPARYVTGFAFDPGINIVNTRHDSGIKYATVSVPDSKAHAWIEFYVEDWGWVQLDVTPGSFEIIDYDEEETTAPEEPSTTAQEEETTTESEEETTEPVSESEKITTTEAPSGKTQKFHLSKTAIKVILYIVSVAAFFGVIWLIIYVRYTLIKNKREFYYEEGRKNNLNKCMIANYDGLERIMKYIGIKKEDTCTYEEYGKAIIGRCSYLESADVEEFMKLYEKAIFSSGIISMEELVKAEETLGLLRDSVYNDINVIRKFIFKFICVN